MKRGKGLGLGARDSRKVSFIKLSVAGDVKPSGGGIETTKPFMRGTITQENARNAAGRKFVRHIITQARINTTTKRMKIVIMRRVAV
jgi:hypothetical protein